MRVRTRNIDQRRDLISRENASRKKVAKILSSNPNMSVSMLETRTGVRRRTIVRIRDAVRNSLNFRNRQKKEVSKRLGENPEHATSYKKVLQDVNSDYPNIFSDGDFV